MKFTILFVLILSPLFGGFQSSAYADPVTTYIWAGDAARAHGVIGYIVDDYGNGDVTTYLLANNTDVVTSTQASGCLSMEATPSGSTALALRFTEYDTAQFLQDDEVIAEIGSDGNGGWYHWGTEGLTDLDAYYDLALVTTDPNLNLLAQANCAPEKGYWECVLKVLKCEGENASCLLIGGFGVLSCVETCALFGQGQACQDCWDYYGGVVDPVCQDAIDCWVEAYNENCI